MEVLSILRIWILFSLAIAVVSTMDQERKVYIAYMGSLPKGEYSPSSHHSRIIKQLVDPRFASKSLVRSYTRTFNGFAANLTKDEYKRLTGYEGVVSVFPCQKLELQTTRSWDFMGFLQKTERVPAIESDIIVGIIDSGIWPESESFNDQGFGPIPTKWRGECQGGKDFTCNRKIIGARRYSIEPNGMDFSARDMTGHGTHCASIVAGNEVIDASYYGLAQGVARGGVPYARIAIYKVCNPDCHLTDVLSAFHDAVADGVDIISISISQRSPVEIHLDAIAIGSFHAVEKGILTVHSAGNKGPGLSSIASYAPWKLTVGASDIDRRIIGKLLLGKEAVLAGNGINAFTSSDHEVPLVYGKEVTSRCSEMDARNCVTECLESSLVEKKVVLCDKQPTFETFNVPGALGYIMPNDRRNFSSVTPYPLVAISANGLQLVKSYKNSTIEPKVQILKSEAVENPGAPFVAVFSSRGPSTFLPDIIKPDVTAPGVEILAAFSPAASQSQSTLDKNSVKYIIQSGTSMACPHVAAAAAYVKSFHPEWSPSAVKSALMTTAWEFKADLPLEAEFAYGSGHIYPLKAINPGLIYETSFGEYMKFWCNIPDTLGSKTDTNVTCPTQLTAKEVNYPSMAAQVDIKTKFLVSFPRTVTNVGKDNSTYIASIEGSHSGLHIRVDPSTLQFSGLNQKMSFVVTIKGKWMRPLKTKRMTLLWTDGAHRVRSPIVVYTMQNTSAGEKVAMPMFYLGLLIFMIMVVLY